MKREARSRTYSPVEADVLNRHICENHLSSRKRTDTGWKCIWYLKKVLSIGNTPPEEVQLSILMKILKCKVVAGT